MAGRAATHQGASGASWGWSGMTGGARMLGMGDAEASVCRNSAVASSPRRRAAHCCCSRARRALISRQCWRLQLTLAATEAAPSWTRHPQPFSHSRSCTLSGLTQRGLPQCWHLPAVQTRCVLCTRCWLWPHVTAMPARCPPHPAARCFTWHSDHAFQDQRMSRLPAFP